MMGRTSWRVALGLLVSALLTAGCHDGAQPVGADVEAGMNAVTAGEPGGPNTGVIGAGPGEAAFTTSDTTGRGPGGTIGSGH